MSNKTVEVDYKALGVHASNLAQKSKEMNTQYSILKSNLDQLLEKGLMDEKGKQFAKYISEQQGWIFNLKESFDKFEDFVSKETMPLIKYIIDIDMSGK